jgi:hypothetical protein
MNHLHHHHSTRRIGRVVLAGAATLALAAPGVAFADGGSGPPNGPWSTASKIDEVNDNHPDVNSSALDGCPIQSPDGLHLYLASNRGGGLGGLDIWMSTRDHRSDPWGAPQALPAPVNSTADDFCPTPLEGGRLLFVSRRAISGVTCGLGDIYITRNNPASGWADPTHLPCAPLGPNSALDEQGPSLAQGQLYFSRGATGVPGELFVSTWDDGTFGPAAAIGELNDAGANDIQPNVRKDGRELVFSSNRAGGQGGQDIWAATRANVDSPWSAPVNVGTGVNTAASESRPSLSNDALQLLFGRTGGAGSGEGQTGASDIYVSTRARIG